ncbi:MAG: hypothetical protein AB1757_30155 [Acidobacteriota bacterium]
MNRQIIQKNQTLATLLMVFACFQPLALIGGFFAFTIAAAGTFAAPTVDDPALKWYTAMAVWGVAMVAISMALFVLALIAGIGMKKYKHYGRLCALLAAVLALFEIPIGTILGIYALIFLCKAEVKQIYANQSQL